MTPDERLKALSQVPPFGWIALSADESRLVATGSSYSEVVDKAAAEGEDDPVLIMRPAIVFDLTYEDLQEDWNSHHTK